MNLQKSVEEEIRQYQLVSKSKSLRNINRKNIGKIAKAIDEKQFKDVMIKKHQVLQKLYKLLNNSINDGLIDNVNLESLVITNRYLAEKYLTEHLYNDDDKCQQIKHLIIDHNTYRDEMQRKRQTLDNADELRQLDLEIWHQCQKYEGETAEVLQEMRMPFFNIDDNYSYPELPHDKHWLIQKLNELFIP